VGPDHRAEDRARPEAGQRRAVDAVPRHPGLPARRARRPRRSLLSHRPRRRGRGPAPLRRGHRLRRRGARRVRGRPTARVEVHGPGYSKVLLGPEPRPSGRSTWTSWSRPSPENGGRSCSQRVGRVDDRRTRRRSPRPWPSAWPRIVPRAEDDPEAQLAPFANPCRARASPSMIDRDLGGPRAPIDLTARHRRAARRGVEGRDLPAARRWSSANRPSTRWQPRVSCSRSPPWCRSRPEDIPDALGPTLATSVITSDPRSCPGSPRSPKLHRLNLARCPRGT
jgi:hypothetical protein